MFQLWLSSRSGTPTKANCVAISSILAVAAKRPHISQAYDAPAAVLELFRPLTPLAPLSLTFVSEPSAQICRHCSHLHAENLGAFKWVSLAGAKYIK